MDTRITKLLDIAVPIVQAPMAGTSTPALAAAVSNSGGLGSLGLGACSPDEAAKMIAETRKVTNQPFNLNFFVHERPIRDIAKEVAWLDTIKPFFDEYETEQPKALSEIFTSFNVDDDMFEVVLDLKPAVVSFHFGLPSPSRVSALKEYGAFLISTVTNRDEALKAVQAGMDAVVAQGFEAGGHRGTFNTPFEDGYITTMALIPLIVETIDLPVIAAGGIMNGNGIAASLALGASAVQMGTAFVSTNESAANQAYRDLLLSDRAFKTEITNVISGRPARALINRFTDELRIHDRATPGYPMTYEASKALNAAASAKGSQEFMPMWAGQGAGLSRPMAAHDLMKILLHETNEVIGQLKKIH